jgi:hypothetical protein
MSRRPKHSSDAVRWVRESRGPLSRHSGMRRLAQASDAQLRIGENITTNVDAARSCEGAPLLDGFRGSGKSDIPALAQLISQLSQLAAQCRGQIAEIELNPVLVHPEGQGSPLSTHWWCPSAVSPAFRLRPSRSRITVP